MNQHAVGTAPSTSATPAHEQVYQKLRALILFGEIAPGQAVTIQGLVETLGAGMTPVREALRRLIAEGALTFQGNRRVSVPELSPSDVEELIFIRQTLECELTRRAIASVKPDDISILKRIDVALDQAISQGDIRAYLEQNYRFHSSLYAIANAPVLASIADRLWLRFGPSLRVVCGRYGTQNLPDKHHDLINALQRGDADAAVQALKEDVLQGMGQVMDAIQTEIDAKRFD